MGICNKYTREQRRKANEIQDLKKRARYHFKKAEELLELVKEKELLFKDVREKKIKRGRPVAKMLR